MYFSIFATHHIVHMVTDYTEIFLGVTAIIGVLLGLSRWIVKKIEAANRDDVQLQAIIKGQEKLVGGVTKTNEDLKEHMEEEKVIREEEYNLIQENINTNTEDHTKIFEKIDIIMETQSISAHRQVENTLSMVKSLYKLDEAPVLIYKVDPENWRAIWANETWTRWTGLSLEETRAGGDLSAIKEDSEREIIEPTVTQTGRAKEEMNLEYTLQNPTTKEVIGRVSAHAEMIDPYNGEYWYYVARLALLEEYEG